MNYISISYAVKFEIDFATEYVFTSDKICINSKTGRKIKQVMKNRCIGYIIKGKFYSLTFLRKHLRKPQKEEMPF